MFAGFRKQSVMDVASKVSSWIQLSKNPWSNPGLDKCSVPMQMGSHGKGMRTAHAEKPWESPIWNFSCRVSELLLPSVCGYLAALPANLSKHCLYVYLHCPTVPCVAASPYSHVEQIKTAESELNRVKLIYPTLS